MKQRVIYGTLFALLTVGMIVLCQPTRVIFFVTCALIAAHEMRKALEKCGYHPLAWPVMTLCVSSTLLLYFGKAGYVFPVFMIIMIALFGQMILGGKISVKDVLSTLAVCAYPVSPLLLMVYISVNDAIWAAVFLNSIVPAIVSDTFALFGGRRFGKHKLSPHISPHKTVEGLLCGLACGTLSGFAVYGILHAFGRGVIPMWAVIVAALASALAGALGDLAASSVKRAAQIKDYSHLIPGHGGMLDRVDSALFAIPVCYMIYALFV